MNGLARAQHAYDLAQPDEPERMTEFSDRDVEALIARIAAMTTDQFVGFAWHYLDFDPRYGSAEITIQLCKAWLASPEAVHAVAGTDFWQHMRQMALESFEPQQIEQQKPRDDRKYND